jgi:hypothetical protein
MEEGIRARGPAHRGRDFRGERAVSDATPERLERLGQRRTGQRVGLSTVPANLPAGRPGGQEHALRRPQSGRQGPETGGDLDPAKLGRKQLANPVGAMAGPGGGRVTSV